jgi:hypothetical protein
VADIRALLEAGDVEGLREAWKRAAPHLPQPKSFEDAEIAMHHARTLAETVGLQYRRYSHAWLTERMLPSGLPAELKPTIAEAVGISVNFHSSFLKPAAAEIRGAMEHAVLDRFAMGDKDPVIVQAAMSEARDRTMRALFGRG